MQGMVPGHRLSSQPGEGKQDSEAARIQKGKKLVILPARCAAKCENTEGKLAGAAALLLQLRMSVSMRNE